MHQASFPAPITHSDLRREPAASTNNTICTGLAYEICFGIGLAASMDGGAGFLADLIRISDVDSFLSHACSHEGQTFRTLQGFISA